MKKKIVLSLLIITLFVVTGCGNDTSKTVKINSKTETKETQTKVKFTKEVVKESNHVKYKVPEDTSDMGSFKDLGKSCYLTYYTNQTSVYALYPYDENVEKVDKVTINGFNYDTYKYQEKSIIHYVYRTKVNNDYHLFMYDVYDKEYDDSQVEAFMNTVEFTYDSINYKQ